jgi:hypothetical protein
MAVRADIGDPAHTVDVKYDKICTPCSGDGGRRVDFKLGAGAGKSLADKRAHLARDEVQHHAAHALGGIVDVLGDFDAAVLADGQNAVVVQQRLGAGLLFRLDDILEEHPVLNPGRDRFLEARMSDRHLPFDGRKDADINILRGRAVRPCRSGAQKHGCCSGYQALGMGGHCGTTSLAFPSQLKGHGS